MSNLKNFFEDMREKLICFTKTTYDIKGTGNRNWLKICLVSLWYIGFPLFFSLLIWVFVRIENMYQILPPLAILLSALIASLSLMLSIESNKQIKSQDIKNENKSATNRLSLYTKRLYSNLEVIKSKNSFNKDETINELKKYIEAIEHDTNLISVINSDDINMIINEADLFFRNINNSKNEAFFKSELNSLLSDSILVEFKNYKLD